LGGLVGLGMFRRIDKDIDIIVVVNIVDCRLAIEVKVIE